MDRTCFYSNLDASRAIISGLRIFPSHAAKKDIFSVGQNIIFYHFIMLNKICLTTPFESFETTN